MVTPAWASNVEIEASTGTRRHRSLVLVDMPRLKLSAQRVLMFNFIIGANGLVIVDRGQTCAAGRRCPRHPACYRRR